MGASNSSNEEIKFEKNHFCGTQYVNIDENSTFFEKIISDLDFFCISQSQEDISIFNQIKTIFNTKIIQFISFSFIIYKGESFFTICFENNCFIISRQLLKNEKLHNDLIFPFKKEMKELLISMTQRKIHMVQISKILNNYFH